MTAPRLILQRLVRSLIARQHLCNKAKSLFCSASSLPPIGFSQALGYSRDIDRQVPQALGIIAELVSKTLADRQALPVVFQCFYPVALSKLDGGNSA